MTSTEPTVTWQRPAGRAQAGAANKIAELLRSNPYNPDTQEGWAIIEEYPVPVAPANADEETKDRIRLESRTVRAKASSRASLIKQGRVAAFRSKLGTAGAFDAVSRSEYDADGQRVIRVYATYLGEEHAKPREDKSAKPVEPAETEGTVEVASVEDQVAANA